MSEQITSAEMAKAARNLERLADFIGVRRRWTVAEPGRAPVKAARKAGEAIAEVICRISGGEIATPIGVEQPSELEPAGEVSSARLTRFADYLDQLSRWFEDRGGARLPSGMEDHARSIQRSLAAADEALQMLLDEKAPKPEPEPEPDPREAAFNEPEPLTRADLGPVAVVDPDARLILDHTWQKSLLQKRGNIMELTPETVKKLDTFFSEQGFELNSHEKRRLYEKVQRWIEATPNKRVLVLRVSGLSGKPDVLSSFQPKEDEDDPSAVAPSMYGSAVVERLAGQTQPDENRATKPAVIESPPEDDATEPAAVTPPVIARQAPAVELEEEFVVPDVIEEPKKKSLLEEYMANPPSGVIPLTVAPPIMDDSSDDDTKDDD
jgi:hypothetical protein